MRRRGLGIDPILIFWELPAGLRSRWIGRPGHARLPRRCAVGLLELRWGIGRPLGLGIWRLRVLRLRVLRLRVLRLRVLRLRRALGIGLGLRLRRLIFGRLRGLSRLLILRLLILRLLILRLLILRLLILGRLLILRRLRLRRVLGRPIGGR